MNYYERHLGDYARDTAHLSLLEHGVYTLLLDRYYATEQPIPADQAHRVARARSRDERHAVDSVLAEFFTLVETENGPAFRNFRADEEIEKARVRIVAAQQNGRRGGRPKKNPPGFDGEPNGFSLGSENKTQQKAHQTPDTITTPDSLSVGTRDARPPEHDVVGYLEGHPEPAPNPLAPFAIALNRAGFRCTAMNPDLVAYAKDGGSVEHLQQIAAMPECKGKSAVYVLRFARREITQPAPAIEPRALTTTGSQHAGGGKTTAAILALEDFARERR